MAKWLKDLNNFGRPFWYAAGVFAMAVGSYALLASGRTLLGDVLGMVTLVSGLMIVLRTRHGAFD